MKVDLHGKHSKNMNKFSPSEIESLVKSLGFEVVTSKADLIISYGGDGTLLSSERHYPGVPKLPIRNSLFYKKCSKHQEENLLKAVAKNQLQLKEYLKLETKIENHTLLALNDFVVRNKEAVHAIRFQIPSIDTQLLIGDGIVLSTPFGSTGYFKSITQKTFSKGFGLAFNNTTTKVNPVIFNEGEKVIFKLVRGHAVLTFDNSHSQYTIKEGSELIFKLSSQKAKIYLAESLRCPNCKVIRS